jgi:hypothetical protein
MRRVRCGTKKGELNTWTFQKIESTFYYRHDAIPNRKPACYQSQLPSAEELVAMAKQTYVEPKGLADEASEYIAGHFTKYTTHYNEYEAKQALSLAKACAFLEWAVRYLQVNSIDVRPNALFEEFGAMVQTLELSYIPSYYRNLKYKILAVYNGEASIAEQIDLPRVGNSNAVQHKEDQELIGWIYQLRSMGQNWTNSHIIRKVKGECAKVGKPEPSDRWIGEVMESWNNKFLTANGRFGDKSKYSSVYRSSMPTANALFAGECWEMDATRVNMIPHAGKEGNKLQFLYIIAVRDVYSGDVVGMHFDLSEDRWAYVNALRNAVENTGYLPYELRYDRFPGHNTEEMKNLFSDLMYLGVKLTCTYKASGKARMERWFGSMQSIALQESPMYYGEGIMSNRKSAHRSADYLAKIRKVAKESGWDFDTASQEAEMRIEKWLNTPYSQWSRKYANVEKSAKQLHDESEKPSVNFVGQATIAYLFGLRKMLQVRHNGLIRTEINKEEFVYRIEDYSVVSRYGQVLCCYDVNDLSVVHIYEPGIGVMKKYLGIANEVAPVVVFGTDAGKGLGKQMAIIKHIEEQREQELQLKVANGGMTWQNDLAIRTPLKVSKQEFESAESVAVNRYVFKEDDGAGLNYDPTNDL